MIFECSQYRMALTVIRLIASSLADGIKTERLTPANCNVNLQEPSFKILYLFSIQ